MYLRCAYSVIKKTDSDFELVAIIRNLLWWCVSNTVSVVKKNRMTGVEPHHFDLITFCSHFLVNCPSAAAAAASGTLLPPQL